MELSKVTINDLYELVNNTLTGGWTVKKFKDDIRLDIYDSEADTYIDMEIVKDNRKVDLTFTYFHGDDAYFSEEKSYYYQDELLEGLKKINHIANSTLDEVLTETNYNHRWGTYKDIL